MSPDRAAGILARFNAAHTSLIHRLRDLSPAVAEEAPQDDTWSAAQIGWHVAATNDWVAGVLLGSASPAAQPAPAGFQESFSPSSIPEKLKTFPSLEPPRVVGRDSAVERLRSSAQQLTKAIASLTPERGGGYIVSIPHGTLSLFELADFAGVHVTRHVAQIERTVAMV